MIDTPLAPLKGGIKEATDLKSGIKGEADFKKGYPYEYRKIR